MKPFASKQTCWNCGRKANETCSGCNLARYCGSYCQHKDWEQHHQDCRSNAVRSAQLVTETQLATQKQTTAQPARSTANTNSSNSSSTRSSPTNQTSSGTNGVVPREVNK